MKIEKIVDLIDRLMIWIFYVLIFFVVISKAAIEICITFLVILWIIKWALNIQKIKEIRWGIFKSEYSSLNKPILVFILVVFISCLFSTNIATSMRPFFSKFLEHILLVFLFVSAFGKGRRKEIRIFFCIFIISTILLVADSAWQFAFGKDFLRGFSGPPLVATLGDPNTLAGYLLLPFFMMLSFTGFKYENKRGNIYLLFIALSIALFLTLVFTYSRGAWIAFFVGMLIFVFLVRKRRYILWVLIISALMALTIFLSPIIMRQFRSIFTIYSTSGGIIRLSTWKISLDMIEDFPFFGVGLNQFKPALLIYSPEMYRTVMHQHNMFLKIGTDAGLVGLCAFAWVMIKIFKMLFMGMKTSTKQSFGYWVCLGVFCSLVATLVHGLVDATFFAPQVQTLFWILIGLVSVVSKRIVET